MRGRVCYSPLTYPLLGSGGSGWLGMARDGPGRAGTGRGARDARGVEAADYPYARACAFPHTNDMQSLHRASGKTTKHNLPNEREGLALAAAAAMQWSQVRDSCSPMFFPSIADAVKQIEKEHGTERTWSRDDVVFFVQERLFAGIPQYAVEKWIQKEFLGKRGTEIIDCRFAVIRNFIFRYLAAVNSGVDYESSMKLARQAHLTEVSAGAPPAPAPVPASCALPGAAYSHRLLILAPGAAVQGPGRPARVDCRAVH